MYVRTYVRKTHISVRPNVWEAQKRAPLPGEHPANEGTGRPGGEQSSPLPWRAESMAPLLCQPLIGFVI